MTDAPQPLRPKFSVCLIVRNCAKILDRCLTSIRAMEADEIVVLNTAAFPMEAGAEDTDEVARNHGAVVFRFPWNGSFADARNHAFDLCKNEVVVWLDSDDTVVHPDRLANNVRMFAESDANCMGVGYMYEFVGTPGKSECSTELIRERVVKRSEFQWKSPIHEVLCCKYQIRQMNLPKDGGYVMQHLSKLDRNNDVGPKLKRNIDIFEKHWPDGKCEARMIFYWGNTLLGLNRFPEAVEKYSEYLNTPGTASSERLLVLNSTSEAYRRMGQFKHAALYAAKAITQAPHLPSGWLQSAEASFMMNNYEMMLHHANQVDHFFQNHRQELVSNAAALSARPHFFRAFYALEVNKDPSAAKGAIDQAMAIMPNEPSFLALEERVGRFGRKSELVKAFRAVCSSLSEEMASDVAESAPVNIRYEYDLQAFWDVPPPKEGTPRLAIVCGETGLFGWDQASIDAGIGGSEEAAIHAASEFAARGWSVDVYNKREDVVLWGENVRFIPFSCWGKVEYDVAVYWRMTDGPAAFPSDGFKVLWLHDVTLPENHLSRYWEKFDQVMCLSQYHIDVCFPDEKPDNILLTSNALKMDDRFPSVESLTNDLDKVVWTSDPSRGIVNIAEIWDRLKLARPNLTLDIYYGFSEVYMMHEKQMLADGDTRMTDTRDFVMKFAERDDVTFHGMVSQQECHEAMARAGWWLYPTNFPEIHCISALKAQALGCRSICVDDFALTTTGKHCLKVSGRVAAPIHDDGKPFTPADRTEFLDRYAEICVDMMKSPEKMDEYRNAGIEWARGESWAKVTQDWEESWEEVSDNPLAARLQETNTSPS